MTIVCGNSMQPENICPCHICHFNRAIKQYAEKIAKIEKSIYNCDVGKNIYDPVMPPKEPKIKGIEEFDSCDFDVNTVGMKSRWVKCTDELPKENKRYLGYCLNEYELSSWEGIVEVWFCQET